MDPKEFELIIAAFSVLFTGGVASVLSYQELRVHQAQLQIESNKAAVEANDAALRANMASLQITQYQCDAAREIFATATPNPSIPSATSDALYRWAANKLLECTK